MSVAAITAAWQVECEPTHKLVLLALADHADDERWECWPSIGHIQRKTGLARSTVAAALKSLESQAIIARKRRQRQQTTVYTLNVDRWSVTRTSSRERLVRETDGVVRQPDGGSPTVGHGTVIEPSRNRQGVRFEEFWTAYPSPKRGKKPSLEKWKQKHLDTKADTIIADVKARAQRDRQWLQGYIPNPATYLNQERWEDEWEPVSNPESDEVVY